MANQKDIWDALSSGLGREWMALRDVYSVLGRVMGLSDSEMGPRWKRNVRNVLQRRKASGEVEWDGSGKYRLTARVDKAAE